MNNYSKNDSSEYIASVLGERLKRLRLNKDMTQVEVAEKAWIKRRTVLNAEKGDVRLSDLIAILRALDMLGNLDVLIRSPIFSNTVVETAGEGEKKASGKNKRQSQAFNWLNLIGKIPFLSLH